MSYPTIKILPGEDRRLRNGSPWLFSNELRMDEAAKAVPPGSLVRLMGPTGKILGVAHFNPHSLIAARLLTRNKDAVIDRAFIARRIARALALRERLFDAPFYRLVHAEADGLPGLVVDRFGDTLVVQLNTAGMNALEPLVVEALDEVLSPGVLIARNDTPSRGLEGLPAEVRVLKGEAGPRLEVIENGLSFAADPLGGQKTGWFYDQRPNRLFTAGLCRGEAVLDVYTYCGGFALTAAAHGAKSVVAVDGSAHALALAAESAARQGSAERCSFQRADAFTFLDEAAREKRRFGVVIADPPAFVKSRKDLGSGLRGYRKLARLAAALVTEPGFLCLGCCSHHVSPDQFAAETWAGIREAGRGGRLLRSAGAGPDHPVHPALPETAYLKFLVYALD
ncbi:class I SAM-dependent rRNA methyltransferase [Benzoatithermus flavus]|uniref:Class I SAM-dependent rRNA methyltransferase n=1 Tax=Benzoatithermus flavus TaxID=3108223 RepID=A0ABU8XTH0_9PROT